MSSVHLTSKSQGFPLPCSSPRIRFLKYARIHEKPPFFSETGVEFPSRPDSMESAPVSSSGQMTYRAWILAGWLYFVLQGDYYGVMAVEGYRRAPHDISSVAHMSILTLGVRGRLAIHECPWRMCIEPQACLRSGRMLRGFSSTVWWGNDCLPHDQMLSWCDGVQTEPWSSNVNYSGKNLCMTNMMRVLRRKTTKFRLWWCSFSDAIRGAITSINSSSSSLHPLQV